MTIGVWARVHSCQCGRTQAGRQAQAGSTHVCPRGRQVITRDEFAKIVGPRPFPDSSGTHPDDDAVYPALQVGLRDPATSAVCAGGAAPDATHTFDAGGLRGPNIFQGRAR